MSKYGEPWEHWGREVADKDGNVVGGSNIRGCAARIVAAVNACAEIPQEDLARLAPKAVRNALRNLIRCLP